MNRALFHPCCGPDIVQSVRYFAGSVERIDACDIWPQLLGCMESQVGFHRSSAIAHRFEVELSRGDIHSARDSPEITPRAVGELIEGSCTLPDRTIPLVRIHRYDAVEALRQVDSFSIFFFRRDGPTEGEGSSGIPFLGDTLFERVLTKLSPDGLVVTDGAGMGGQAAQSALWTAPREPDPVGRCFESFGRRFRCVRVLSRDRTPTLVWQSEATS
jgi:hypothetical protein